MTTIRSTLLFLGLLAMAACGGKTTGDQKLCTVLGGVRPAGVDQQRQVRLDVKVIEVADDFFDSLGIDFDFVLSHVDDVFPATGGQFDETQTIGVPFNVVGGMPFGSHIVPASHLQGMLLPFAYVGAFPGLGGGDGFVMAPGEVGDCLRIEPAIAQPVLAGPGSLLPLNLLPPAGSLDLGTGFAFERLDLTQINAVMQAIDGDPQAQILSQPSINLFSGQRGMFVQRAEQANVDDLLQTVQDSLGGLASGIQFLHTGVTLDVRPIVSADDQTVLLEIRPTTHGAIATQNTGAQVNGTGVTVQLPIFQPVTTRTTVSVPDGGTILLGGIKQLADNGRAGVPLLSKIPYINRLFKTGQPGWQSEPLMIMVTPRIIITEEE